MLNVMENIRTYPYKKLNELLSKICKNNNQVKRKIVPVLNNAPRHEDILYLLLN